MTDFERAKYGAAAQAGQTGELPGPFPRIMGPNAMRYLQYVVDSGLMYDMVGRFEKAFAQALGVKHCIAAPGCTPSLAMLAAALPASPGDEVIVSCVTDYGTVQGVIRENLIPVFADTVPGTVIVGAETIAERITDRTRAIIVVHKTGTICDMDAIMAIAARHDILVVEDCCQAVFGRYKGRLAGTLAHAAAFSFDAEKTMGSDTGGCIVTNDDALAERMRFIGQSRAAVMEPGFGRRHTEAGYALRMPSCTAALCLAQLEIAHEIVTHRDEMARLLTRLLAEIPGVTPHPIPDYMDLFSCWMMSFSIDPDAFRCSADDFALQVGLEGLTGAGTGRYYLMPEALPFLAHNADAGIYPYSRPPASRSYRYGAATCPNAQRYLERWIRWVSFCERYQPEHCERAAEIVRTVAASNAR
jgi:dTDP-4-amino-4,6-dideoxygalactose transaminase